MKLKSLPRLIMRMQQSVRFFAQRLAEELFVQRLYSWVIMGLTQGHLGVFFVEGSDPFFPLGIGGWDRLSAASDTAAWTAHDFDEMEICFLGSDLIQ